MPNSLFIFSLPFKEASTQKIGTANNIIRHSSLLCEQQRLSKKAQCYVEYRRGSNLGEESWKPIPADLNGHVIIVMLAEN